MRDRSWGEKTLWGVDHHKCCGRVGQGEGAIGLDVPPGRGHAHGRKRRGGRPRGPAGRGAWPDVPQRVGRRQRGRNDERQSRKSCDEHNGVQNICQGAPGRGLVSGVFFFKKIGSLRNINSQNSMPGLGPSQNSDAEIPHRAPDFQSRTQFLNRARDS